MISKIGSLAGALTRRTPPLHPQEVLDLGLYPFDHYIVCCREALHELHEVILELIVFLNLVSRLRKEGGCEVIFLFRKCLDYMILR